MRAFAAAAAGLLLAFGVALGLVAFAVPDPEPVESPLRVTAPPALP